MREGLRHIFFYAAMLCGTLCYAQQGTFISQYFNNLSYFNPAVPGNDDALHIHANGRLQWTGADNHPANAFLTAGMPIKLFDRYLIGAGLVGAYTNNGDDRYLQISAQASYKFQIGAGLLSIGIQPAYIELQTKRLPTLENNDSEASDITTSRLRKKGTINLGAGIYYSTPRWWIGFSVQNITSPRLRVYGIVNQQDSLSYHRRPHQDLIAMHPAYIFAVGCNIPLKGTLLSIRPSAIAYRCNGYNDGQVTALLDFKQLLFGGVGYRWHDAVTAVAGVTFRGFSLCYSYDIPCGIRSKGSHGSHELTLGYTAQLDIANPKRYRYRSIRYM